MGVHIHFVYTSLLEILVFVMAAKEGTTKNGPPSDICQQHEEWRTFTPQGSSDKQSHFGNTYYHCSVACVMAVWPTFIPSTVVIPLEVQSRLLPEHKYFIHVTFATFYVKEC